MHNTGVLEILLAILEKKGDPTQLLLTNNVCDGEHTGSPSFKILIVGLKCTVCNSNMVLLLNRLYALYVDVLI